VLHLASATLLHPAALRNVNPFLTVEILAAPTVTLGGKFASVIQIVDFFAEPTRTALSQTPQIVCGVLLTILAFPCVGLPVQRMPAVSGIAHALTALHRSANTVPSRRTVERCVLGPKTVRLHAATASTILAERAVVPFALHPRIV